MNEIIKVHQFYKTGSEWYIDLPEFLEQGGSVGDLQMVDGADTMLDLMVGDAGLVTLHISTHPFAGADVVELIEKCDPYIGGGNYIMRAYEGNKVNRQMWLCQVTAFVFGDIPEKIFVKREMA